MLKSFAYQPLFRIGVPTKDGRIFHASGVWQMRSPCPLLRSESLEGHSFATGTVHGMNFSESSGMAYASGEAEPEIVAGLLLGELVLLPELVTWDRKTEMVEVDGERTFVYKEGTIAAVHVGPKEMWPW